MYGALSKGEIETALKDWLKTEKKLNQAELIKPVEIHSQESYDVGYAEGHQRAIEEVLQFFTKIKLRGAENRCPTRK